MTDTKHTPGPWRANRINGAYTYQDVFHIEDSEGVYIAGVADGSRDASIRKAARNAELIALAPAMYEALSRIKDICDEEKGMSVSGAVIDDIERYVNAGLRGEVVSA